MMISNSAFCRDSDSLRHKLSLGSGFLFEERQDQIFSDRVYSIQSKNAFEIQYSLQKKDLFHEVNFIFWNGESHKNQDFIYSTSFSNKERYIRNPTFLSFDLSYKFSKRIKSSWVVGARLRWETSISKIEYGITQNVGHMINFSLSPAIAKNWAIGSNHRFDLDAEIALINWTARSPYSLLNDQNMSKEIESNGFGQYWFWVSNGSIYTIINHQRLKMESRYTYQFNKKLEVSICYAPRLIRYNSIQQFVSLSHSFLFTINFNF